MICSAEVFCDDGLHGFDFLIGRNYPLQPTGGPIGWRRESGFSIEEDVRNFDRIGRCGFGFAKISTAAAAELARRCGSQKPRRLLATVCRAKPVDLVEPRGASIIEQIRGAVAVPNQADRRIAFAVMFLGRDSEAGGELLVGDGGCVLHDFNFGFFWAFFVHVATMAEAETEGEKILKKSFFGDSGGGRTR